MSTNAASPVWALRVHAAFDWVLWVATVNLLWCVFTLAGGIVLGVAPASVASAELTRRRLRGDGFAAARSFAEVWRREFWRANVALGPSLAVTALLGASTIGQYEAGALGTPLGILTSAALALAFAVTAVAVPLYAHYDLPLRGYVLTSFRWVLRNLPHAVLLLLAAVVVVTASLILPGIIPFLSLGAWLTLSTALCIGFFTANDRRLAEADTPT
ncbi:YesL family protein [Microbacterium sp. NPDC056234]|uniref:YesL family protein n=1 Tax=Microbacterium sp. NPDC056234 TaxID=3345757 RepID=UPI0035E36832